MSLLSLRAVALGIGIALACPAAALAQTPPNPPAQAPAVQPVNVEIIVLHATNEGTGIDPKIGKMPELGQPPFSSYNSYKLLDRSKLPLTKGNAQTTTLPNQRVMAVTLKDVIEPKKKDEVRKFVLSASIQRPDKGKSFLPLLEVNAKAGETLFVAGQSYKGGILVIGIKVLP